MTFRCAAAVKYQLSIMCYAFIVKIVAIRIFLSKYEIFNGQVYDKSAFVLFSGAYARCWDWINFIKMKISIGMLHRDDWF